METVFPLAQFSKLSWTKIFSDYNSNVHRFGDDRKRWRYIEDDLERVDHIRSLISKNSTIVWDINNLESLERNHLQYQQWLGEVESRFKFGKDITELNFKTKIRDPFTKESHPCENPKKERFFLLYNLASINYAKGERL